MTIMEPHEQQGEIAQSDNKMMDELTNQYANVVKQEGEKQTQLHDQETTRKFEEIKTLGFLTKRDLDDFGKGVTEQLNEVKKLRDEFTTLREFMLRAKAQGVTSGMTDGPQKQAPRENPMMGMMHGRT